MARLESNNFLQLNENILEKLHLRNIYTVYDFMLYTSDNLTKQTGLNFKEIEEMKTLLFKKFGGQMVNSIDVYEHEKEDMIPTGIKNLDNLLEGGLRYRKIYEICGYSSSGKSQFCHWISVYTTIYTSTEVHYLDGSRNFCISRIQMILEEKQCSDNIVGKVMTNIKVHQIQKVNDLFRVFHYLSKIFNKDQTKTSKKLIIVDSLSVLLSKIANTELNCILSNFASVCRFLVNNFCAIIINVNTIKLEHARKIFNVKNKHLSLNIKPSLGNYWLCIPNVRLVITLFDNTHREISVWNSGQFENRKKCIINIKDNGIS